MFEFKMSKKEQFTAPVIALAVVLLLAVALAVTTPARRGSASTRSGDSAERTASVVAVPAGAPVPIPSSATKYCNDDPAGVSAVDTVRQALLLNQRFNTRRSGDLSRVLDSSGAEALARANDAEISALYEPDLARDRTALYKESVVSLVGNKEFLALGGGVSTFECVGLDRTGDAVVLRALATTWATFGDLSGGQPKYAQPSNVMALTSVISLNGKIRELNLEFADGIAP